MKIKGGNQKGFTLLEMMIVVVIASIMAYMIGSVFRSGSRQASAINTTMTVQEAAQRGISRMIEEIRETSPTRITVANNSLTFQIPTAVDDTGAITWSGNIQYSIGGLNNTQLLRLDGNGNVAVIANDVLQAVFTANVVTAPTLITIRLDTQRQTVEGRPYIKTLTGQAEVRNDV